MNARVFRGLLKEWWSIRPWGPYGDPNKVLCGDVSSEPLDLRPTLYDFITATRDYGERVALVWVNKETGARKGLWFSRVDAERVAKLLTEACRG